MAVAFQPGNAYNFSLMLEMDGFWPTQKQKGSKRFS
jgi:hypothetical protein